LDFKELDKIKDRNILGIEMNEPEIYVEFGKIKKKE